MKVRVCILTILAGLAFVSFAHAQDKHQKSFTQNNVVFSTWEYSSGGSGYLKIENQNNHAVALCWTIHFANGSTDSGCNSSFAARDVRQSSCYRCATVNGGGVTRIEVTKNKFIG